MRSVSFPLASVLCAALASPLHAQSADKPLGGILESIEEATEPRPAPPPPPPEPVEHVPVPPDGIGTTPLPPSRIGTPFGAPTPEPVEDEIVSEAEAIIAPGVEELPELTEAERQAQWEAAERARLEALDRARAEREAAARRAAEARQAEYERQLAEREAAIEQARAEYQAELQRLRLQAERQRAEWLARVRACEEGDRDACAQPGEY
jgi:hypothetical protein